MKKEYDFSKGRRGAVVPTPAGKTRVTIRLDNDVLAWFRDRVDQAGGGNYQSLINQALRLLGELQRLEKTLERASLIGSIYKRRALIDEAVGRRARIAPSLRQYPFRQFVNFLRPP
jgi:hypothetical protein